MLANLGGSVLIMVLTGLGFGVFYAILTGTRVLDGARFNNGWTATDLRKNFKYVVAVALVGTAVAGWFAGPSILDALGVAL